jgi:glutamyl-tRNA(Gln) amidotransferase subunit E
MAKRGGPDSLLVGIEVHQQLSCSTKLFCACPPSKSEDLPYAFQRSLRPAQSELGRVDPAAVFEFSKGRSNVYLWSPESSCLVEADEEPPHELSKEAMDAALLVATLLDSNVVDEVHVMRKIVIDGSNTSGFQRTAVVALGGQFRVDGATVAIQSVTLEEDAARILGEDEKSRRFVLDRLGLPLVEVALAPVSGSPEFVGRVTLQLGRLLRSTGRVARGLGTIRQDLNISVAKGKVVEVKGVQKLNLVAKVVEYESRRQRGLAEVAERLRGRGVRRVTCAARDVSRIFAGSSSKVLRERLESGGCVWCIGASGMKGLLGWEPSPNVRLGRELAEVARANSLGGIIHSDEFRSQGVSEAEEARLKDEFGSGPEDALILVAGPLDAVKRSTSSLVERLEAAAGGVPAETRAPTESGETRYMRPRPGSERMYPETDIPDIVVSRARLKELSRTLPEGWEESVARLAREYSLSEDMALKVYDSGFAQGFEAAARELHLEPSVVASAFVETTVRLAREGVSQEALSSEVLTEVLRAVDAGSVAKEVIPEVLRAVGTGLTVPQAIESLGLEAVDEAEIRLVVGSLIDRRGALIAEKGEGAFSALMGEAMRELRGRADGATVGTILREELLAAVGGKRSRGRGSAP